MAFSYCPHCGYKNMYSLQAPKFCGGCGENIDILSSAKTNSANKISPKLGRKTLRRQRSIGDLEDDDPEGTDVYEVPNITKLSYSIEQDTNKFQLRDVFPDDMIQKIEKESKSSTPMPKKRGRPRKN